ncbi:hypothetical protein F5X99DRAFT_105164 [Biscogniauxia marginata]|nr:hypothetical protein F5X99DRAFT_105164 [Biscogniauxia marginata]
MENPHYRLGGYEVTLVDGLWIGLVALEAVMIMGALGRRAYKAIGNSRLRTEANIQY